MVCFANQGAQRACRAQPFAAGGSGSLLPTGSGFAKSPLGGQYKPLFPGYIFIKVNLGETGVNLFNWLPGALSLVSFGDAPARLSPPVIAEIEKRVEAINAAGGLQFTELERGDRVRIVEGPLAGYEGMFDMRLSGKNRVQVLLAFLSKHPQPVQLDASDIEKLDKDDKGQRKS